MDHEPRLPISISLVGDRFLLFDIDVISWLRRAHHICGVMGGTLPQAPSQNIFLGLPMQIMPEEAQLLVEKGVGYIVDDASAHERAIRSSDSSRHAAYMNQIRQKSEKFSKINASQKDAKKRQALSRQAMNRRQQALPTTDQRPGEEDQSLPDETLDDQPSLFDPGNPSEIGSRSRSSSLNTGNSFRHQPLHGLTPTSSCSFLEESHATPTSNSDIKKVPNVPPSYPLFRHLNSKSYFLTPGLRFGCQYCVYPGDPLRFHSHFLAVGLGWEEEIDLMDIVGGGRLGTGVKKGFLLGGVQPQPQRQQDGSGGSGSDDRTNASNHEREGGRGARDMEEVVESEQTEDDGSRVRTFSIEWAAM